MKKLLTAAILAAIALPVSADTYKDEYNELVGTYLAKKQALVQLNLFEAAAYQVAKDADKARWAHKNNTNHLVDIQYQVSKRDMGGNVDLRYYNCNYTFNCKAAIHRLKEANRVSNAHLKNEAWRFKRVVESARSVIDNMAAFRNFRKHKNNLARLEELHQDALNDAIHR